MVRFCIYVQKMGSVPISYIDKSRASLNGSPSGRDWTRVCGCLLLPASEHKVNWAGGQVHY